MIHFLPEINVFWRQIETGDPDRLEFRYGGEFVTILGGGLCVAISLVVVLMFFPFVPALYSITIKAITGRQPIHSGLVLAAAIMSLVAFVVSGGLFAGVWFLFRRSRIVLNRTAREATKQHRVLPFMIDRTYDLRNLSFISVGWDAGRLRFLGFKALYLHLESGERQRLLLFPWNDGKRGRALARQMGTFLGVSDPADRND